jgi:hypothetical protein
MTFEGRKKSFFFFFLNPDCIGYCTGWLFLEILADRMNNRALPSKKTAAPGVNNKSTCRTGLRQLIQSNQPP